VTELLSELQAKDCLPTQKLRKQELQDYARGKEIMLEVEYEVMEQGWEGQAKGLLQVLWERGFVKEKEIEKYTVPSPYKEGDPYLLRWLMAGCEDFASEKSAMEFLCEQMISSQQDSFEVTMLLTTKYNCEMAGEGIEYSWGVVKRAFRMIPLASKRGRASFHRSVRISMSLMKVELVRKLSAKARRYMLMYRYHDMLFPEAKNKDNGSLSYADIEKYVKKELMCHQYTGNQEYAFILRIYSESIACKTTH
jgi:hypothetical protein